MSTLNYYETIGRRIQEAVSPFAGDIVVWLSLDGDTCVTLYRFDSEDAEWYWESDWYEGQENVSLIDFCFLDDTRPGKSTRWMDSPMRRFICQSLNETMEDEHE